MDYRSASRTPLTPGRKFATQSVQRTVGEASSFQFQLVDKIGKLTKCQELCARNLVSRSRRESSLDSRLNGLTRFGITKCAFSSRRPLGLHQRRLRLQAPSRKLEAERDQKQMAAAPLKVSTFISSSSNSLHISRLRKSAVLPFLNTNPFLMRAWLV